MFYLQNLDLLDKKVQQARGTLFINRLCKRERQRKVLLADTIVLCFGLGYL